MRPEDSAGFAQLSPDLRGGDGDPRVADRLLRALTAGMAPAQARCLSLMFAHWCGVLT